VPTALAKGGAAGPRDSGEPDAAEAPVTAAAAAADDSNNDEGDCDDDVCDDAAPCDTRSVGGGCNWEASSFGGACSRMYLGTPRTVTKRLDASAH